MRKKSNTNFVAEQPKRHWAVFEETGRVLPLPDPHKLGVGRADSPKEYGLWFAQAMPAAWEPATRFVSSGELLAARRGEGMSAASGAGGGTDGSGGGMKIGAGHKPQPYGWHGYYGETGGGSSPGPVYRGKVTLPNEVRREVTPPVQASKVATPSPAPKPAPQSKVTWNGTDPKSRENKLESDMREALHNVGEGRDLNVSSANRPDKRTDAQIVDGKPIDPHADNRAVDINYVNDAHIADVANKGGPNDAELRRQVTEMQDKARTDPNVQAFISPYGGFYRSEKDPTQLTELSPKHPDVKKHWDHVHLAVFRKK